MLQKVMRGNRSLISKILLGVIIFSAILVAPGNTQAAQVTSLRAVFKRIKASTAADGLTLYFVIPTGIQTGGADTITLTFSAVFTLAAEAAANFDIGL